MREALASMMASYIYNQSLPVLSAQLITAPTGRPRDMRNLAPADPPRPGNASNIQ